MCPSLEDHQASRGRRRPQATGTKRYLLPSVCLVVAVHSDLFRVYTCLHFCFMILFLVSVRTHGITKLYHGSVAAMGATWVGHYPWFFTHNYLSQTLPTFDFAYGKHVRYALIGFCSSVVSDTCSNSIRVLKTTKQTSTVGLAFLHRFLSRNVLAVPHPICCFHLSAFLFSPTLLYFSS